MKLLVPLAIATCLLGLATLLLLVVGVVWWRRPPGRRSSGQSRTAAAAFLRQHATDPRLPERLRRLATDSRTPSGVRVLLSGLARYLADPIVLVPSYVPVLGGLDEAVIGSVLLWFAWRRLPADLWAEHFPAPTAPRQGSRLAEALRRDAAAGRHDALLRRLDRELPDWPVASTLVEVTREVLELERNVATARAAGIPDAVTSRLTEEAAVATRALWARADRIAAAAAYRIDTPRLREELAREDEQLVRLRHAIREARAGLAELTLGGGEERDAFRRAERRFAALAATARELQELNQGATL